MKLEIFPDPNFPEQSDLFHDNYELYDYVILGDPRYSKRNLKNYSSRTCRFCGRSYPQARFSNRSHLIPQLIGNSNLYSDFECDDCNARFSALEDDLAAYLGVSRSFANLQGKKKVPGFSSRGMRIKSRSYIGENILIIAPEDVTVDGDKTVIRYKKNRFIPANVYKALLKSAISLLSEHEVFENYRTALGYLNGLAIIDGSIIGGYQLPFNVSMLLEVLCFRRRRQDESIPEKVICFNFQNHILIIPLPSDKILSINYKKIIFPPPYFRFPEITRGAVPSGFQRNLSSTSEVVGEEEIITIDIGENKLSNTVAYDSVTGTTEVRPFDRSGLKHIILAKEGIEIDPADLFNFVKEQMDPK